MMIYRWVQDSRGAKYFDLASIDNKLPSIATVYYCGQDSVWRYIVRGHPTNWFDSVTYDLQSWIDTFDAQSGMSEVNNLLKDNKNIRILSDKELNLL